MLIIIYVVFASVFIGVDVFSGFRETKSLYFLLTGDNIGFSKQRLYVKHQYSDTVSGASTAKGMQVVIGNIKNVKKDIYLRGGYEKIQENKVSDQGGEFYINVWYNEENGKVFFIGDIGGKGSYKKLILWFCFYLGVIPAVIFLIKSKKEQNE